MPKKRKIDYLLLLPVVILLIISFGIIASIAPANLLNHLLFLLFSVLFFLLFSILDIEIIIPFSPIFYFFSLILLILPFIFGTVTRGAVRWIPLAGFTLQPSEIIKPFLVLMFSWFWSRRNFSWKNFLFYCLIYFPAFALIFIQPDLGSSLVTLSIFLGILCFLGISKEKLFVLFLSAVILMPIFWFFLKDYQKMRIIHLINPYSDPYGEGYNVIQSKITIGSGGIFGKGLGKGTQSHLAFLPEKHTDFVFASIGEELGFLGVLTILVLYLLFLLRILKMAIKTREKVYFLLSIGLFFYFSFQSVVNLGMNLGLLPITGIPLPFLSYGGSSMLTSMISLGMLQSVYRKEQGEETLVIK